MKVRAGFVSNSSSSSYIIVLPDNFNPDTDFNWKNVEKELYLDELGKDEDGNTKEQALKVIKSELKTFLKSKSAYSEEVSMRTLINGLDKYVINTIEGGPGYDTMTILDNKKLRKILESSLKTNIQPEAK